MGKLTNKILLEQKEKRFVIYAFDKEGYRNNGYCNIDIVTLTQEVLKYTQKKLMCLCMNV